MSIEQFIRIKMLKKIFEQFVQAVATKVFEENIIESVNIMQQIITDNITNIVDDKMRRRYDDHNERLRDKLNSHEEKILDYLRREEFIDEIVKRIRDKQL